MIRRRLPSGSRPAKSVKSSTFRLLVGSASPDSIQSRLWSSSCDVFQVDDDVGVEHLAELAHLGVGEGSLRRPAAAEDDDLFDAGVREHVDCVIGGVGLLELLASEREHPRHVGRDVPVPDHDDAVGGEVEDPVGEVGVGVVPGDELGRGMAAREAPRRRSRASGRSTCRRRRSPRGSARAGRRGMTSCPTSTLPKNRKPSRAAVFSYTRMTDLIFGWSGATPARTSPNGVGRRSNMSTSTSTSSCLSRCSAV